MPKGLRSSKRLYYSISEVCKITNVKPHVLRYWESEFGQLNPQKNRAGNRVYKKSDIKLIIMIKHLLYEERYTIEGAKKYLEEVENGGRKESINVLEMKSVLSELKSDLSELDDILS